MEFKLRVQRGDAMCEVRCRDTAVTCAGHAHYAEAGAGYQVLPVPSALLHALRLCDLWALRT